MDPNKLIDTLVSDNHGTLTKMAKPERTFLRYGLVATLMVTALALILEVRPNLQEMLATPHYLLQLVILVILSGSSALATVLLVRPGLASRAPKVITIILLCIWPLTVWLSVPEFIEFAIEPESNCPPLASGIGILTSVILFAIVTRGYITRPIETGFYLIVASLSVGGLVLHLVCPRAAFSHVMFWHIIPMYGVGLAVFLGAVSLRKHAYKYVEQTRQALSSRK